MLKRNCHWEHILFWLQLKAKKASSKYLNRKLYGTDTSLLSTWLKESKLSHYSFVDFLHSCVFIEPRIKINLQSQPRCPIDEWIKKCHVYAQWSCIPPKIETKYYLKENEWDWRSLCYGKWSKLESERQTTQVFLMWIIWEIRKACETEEEILKM